MGNDKITNEKIQNSEINTFVQREIRSMDAIVNVISKPDTPPARPQQTQTSQEKKDGD